VARYSETLLADGERIALRARQHWLGPLVEGRIAWVILVASLVLVVLDTQLTPGLMRDLFGWLGLILLVVSLLWLLQIYLQWYAQDYLVTNRRVLKVEGVLKKRSADSSLEKINDAILVQSVFGRILGYGDLDIMTASEETVDRYRMLAAPSKFKRTMLDEKHKLEQDVFQIPAPPLRATPPEAPPPPAPTPAPEPEGVPAVHDMSSDEITRALGDLADLLDRGAISAEEYEAKKQDLLGRL
jgi:hypothetical protein